MLRPGGILLAGFMNPDVFIFDADASENRGELIVRHALPYSDLTHLSAEERERLWGLDAPVEYSHTLTEQIGGQLDAGFVITRLPRAPASRRADRRLPARLLRDLRGEAGLARPCSSQLAGARVQARR